MFRKRHPPAGSRPGTLVVNSHAPQPVIRVMRFTADSVEEHDVRDPQELRTFLSDDAVTWIDVQGLGDEPVLRAIAEVFALHPLALEDVVNVPQRPKVEPFDEHVLLIARMARVDDAHTAVSEQVSIIFGRNFVLTFQERYGDVLDPVRSRIRQGKGPIRNAGADYLAYAILDALIDGYYPVLEMFGESLEELEDTVVATPGPAVLRTIHHVKRELLAIRRTMWPLREAVNTLVHEENPFVSDRVQVYLRDCYDHCIQMIDVVETYRELTGGLMDVYLSSVGNRQNEIMKVLTIMASVFIPLTFLAGIYGMNFENMPELHTRWGYPILLAAMLILGLVMVFCFWNKGWIGAGRAGSTESDDT